jgi:hypothetical protein
MRIIGACARAADCRILWRSYCPTLHIAPLKYLRLHPENVAAALRMYPDRVAMYNSTHLATIPPTLALLPEGILKQCTTTVAQQALVARGAEGRVRRERGSVDEPWGPAILASAQNLIIESPTAVPLCAPSGPASLRGAQALIADSIGGSFDRSQQTLFPGKPSLRSMGA